MAPLYDSVILVLLIVVFIVFAWSQKEVEVPRISPMTYMREPFQSGSGSNGSSGPPTRTVELNAVKQAICNLQAVFNSLQCPANPTPPVVVTPPTITQPAVTIKGSINNLSNTATTSGDLTAFVRPNDMIYFGYLLDVQGPFVVSAVTPTSLTFTTKYLGPNLTDSIMSVVSSGPTPSPTTTLVEVKDSDLPKSEVYVFSPFPSIANRTLAQAQEQCAKYGATVPTLEQMKEAYNGGANWCLSSLVTKNGLPINAKPIQTVQATGICANSVAGVTEDPTPTSLSNFVSCYGVKKPPADGTYLYPFSMPYSGQGTAVATMASDPKLILGSVQAGTSYITTINTSLPDNIKVGDVIEIKGKCNQYDTDNGDTCTAYDCKIGETDWLQGNQCQTYKCLTQTGNQAPHINNGDGTCTVPGEYITCPDRVKMLGKAPNLAQNGTVVNQQNIDDYTLCSYNGEMERSPTYHMVGIEGWGGAYVKNEAVYNPSGGVDPALAAWINEAGAPQAPQPTVTWMGQTFSAVSTTNKTFTYRFPLKTKAYTYDIIKAGAKDTNYTKTSANPSYTYPKSLGPYYVAANPAINKILIRSKVAGDLDANGRFMPASSNKWTVIATNASSISYANEALYYIDSSKKKILYLSKITNNQAPVDITGAGVTTLIGNNNYLFNINVNINTNSLTVIPSTDFTTLTNISYTHRPLTAVYFPYYGFPSTSSANAPFNWQLGYGIDSGLIQITTSNNMTFAISPTTIYYNNDTNNRLTVGVYLTSDQPYFHWSDFAVPNPSFGGFKQISFDGYNMTLMAIDPLNNVWFANANITTAPNWANYPTLLGVALQYNGLTHGTAAQNATLNGAKLQYVSHSNGKWVGIGTDNKIYYSSNYADPAARIDITGEIRDPVQVSFDATTMTVIILTSLGNVFYTTLSGFVIKNTVSKISGLPNVTISRIAYETTAGSGSRISLNKKILGCPAGTAGPSCSPCPAGQSSSSGATTCTPCPAGQTSISGGQCTLCAGGTVGTDGSCSVMGYITSSTSVSTNITATIVELSAGASNATWVSALTVRIPGTPTISLYSSSASVITINTGWIAYGYINENPTSRMRLDTVAYSGVATPIRPNTYFFVVFKQANLTYTAAGNPVMSGAPLPLKICPTGYCCDAGSYSIKYSDICNQCPANAYSAAGAGSCSTCGNNTTSTPGSSSCSNCPNNTSSIGGQSCTSCPTGTTSVGGQACVSCGPNTFVPASGGCSIQTCPTLATIGGISSNLATSIGGMVSPAYSWYYNTYLYSSINNGAKCRTCIRWADGSCAPGNTTYNPFSSACFDVDSIGTISNIGTPLCCPITGCTST